MDEKYLWPLVGVSLGWLLSAFSAAIKDRAEERRKLGRLVTKLLLINDQIDTLIAVTEKFKDHVDGWETYERMRKSVTERHFLEPASYVESLRESIDELAGTLPVEAVSLHGFVDMLLKNKQASLKALSKSHDLYVRGISVYEAGMQLMQRDLDKRIRRLALRHGLETYARVLLADRRKGRNQKSSSSFVDKFTVDSFAELNRMTSAAEAPNPSIETTPNVGAPSPQSAEVNNAPCGPGTQPPVPPHLELQGLPHKSQTNFQPWCIAQRWITECISTDLIQSTPSTPALRCPVEQGMRTAKLQTVINAACCSGP